MRETTLPLSTEGKLAIKQIEVAVFQLETAIDLWVSGADSISILALTHNAHELIYQINRGLPKPRQSLNELSPDLIKEGPKKATILREWPAIFKMDYNACKHGGEDPEFVHHLAVSNNYLTIMDSLHMYAGLGFQRRALFHGFSTWMMVEQPDVFTVKLHDFGQDKAAVDAAVDTAKFLGKKKFFELLIPRFVTIGFAAKGSAVIRVHKSN